MSSFVIRSPGEDEAHALARLHLSTWEETYSDTFPPSAWGEEARQNRVRMWEAICSSPRPDDTIAVAELDGKLIGLAGSGRSEDDPASTERQVYFIYLLQAQQGTGAGQALLDAVIGNESASLWVLEGNLRALAFYARNGFSPDGTRRPTPYDTVEAEIRLVR